jgi:hypothetical protein
MYRFVSNVIMGVLIACLVLGMGYQCTKTASGVVAKRQSAGRLTITMAGPPQGDCEIPAGYKELMVGVLHLTADASGGDVFVSQISVTDCVNGRANDLRAVHDIQLWVYAKNIVDTDQVDVALTTTSHLLSLKEPLVIPTGVTVDLPVVGEIAVDATPGSTHIFKPGTVARDGAVATNAKGERVPVLWERDMSLDGRWVKGHVITVVAPQSGR